MSKVAVLIDGGHLRVLAKDAGKTYDVPFIEKTALKCKLPAETIQRILYYDCAPYTGKPTLPVSGTRTPFTGSDQWLRDLSQRDLFAVRLGVLKFRGWIPKTIPIASAAGLKDSDFKPNFEQKGVDMRIGLDMANYAANRSVDLIVLVTNDTDCIPAMKYARRAGLQVALISFPDSTPSHELLSHCDFRRSVTWP